MAKFNNILKKANELGHGSVENPLYDIIFSVLCEQIIKSYGIKYVQKLCNVKDEFLYIYRKTKIGFDYDHASRR